MTPLINRMVRITPDPELAQWFDMGDTSERPEGHIPDAEMFLLPYKICCVVGKQSNGTAFVLRLQTSDSAESLSVAGFVVGQSDEWKHAIEPFLVVRTDKGLQISTHDGSDPTENSEWKAVLQHVEDFLLSLQQTRTCYTPTPRKSLINSKRASKGKGPVLFDWHTVEIKPPQTKNDPQGGTHASPRRHQVRGYWRTYKSGKRGWVKESWRGDASKGAVFKDYKIKEQDEIRCQS